jgi:hypothetical protein
MRIFPRPRTLGTRLAIGPDGEAWYARSHPTRAIGRVDATRTFAVPDTIGDGQTLVGGRDGALWFLTADAVGRVSLDGTFARVALPEAFTRLSYPPRRFVAGRTNTVWVADGRELAEVDAHRILRTWSLPNASSSIAALTVGCDGTVYVADTLEPSSRDSHPTAASKSTTLVCTRSTASRRHPTAGCGTSATPMRRTKRSGRLRSRPYNNVSPALRVPASLRASLR